MRPFGAKPFLRVRPWVKTHTKVLCCFTTKVEEAREPSGGEDPLASARLAQGWGHVAESETEMMSPTQEEVQGRIAALESDLGQRRGTLKVPLEPSPPRVEPTSTQPTSATASPGASPATNLDPPLPTTPSTAAERGSSATNRVLASGGEGRSGYEARSKEQAASDAFEAVKEKQPCFLVKCVVCLVRATSMRAESARAILALGR